MRPSGQVEPFFANDGFCAKITVYVSTPVRTPPMSPVDFDAKALDSIGTIHPLSLEIEIPPVLRASVERHQANLARLLQSFRAAGLDEAQIEAAVTVVIDSYKHE